MAPLPNWRPHCPHKTPPQASQSASPSSRLFRPLHYISRPSPSALMTPLQALGPTTALQAEESPSRQLWKNMSSLQRYTDNDSKGKKNKEFAWVDTVLELRLCHYKSTGVQMVVLHVIIANAWHPARDVMKTKWTTVNMADWISSCRWKTHCLPGNCGG